MYMQVCASVHTHGGKRGTLDALFYLSLFYFHDIDPFTELRVGWWAACHHNPPIATFYSDKITGVHSHAHLLLKCLKFKPWPSCLHIRIPCLMSHLLAPTMYSCNTTD